MPSIRGDSYDAIVIGGGPGGSSFALTLARRGYSVLVLDREKFPRFRIGESLVPYTLDVLEQLGLMPRLTSHGFILKKGVEISDHDGGFRKLDLDLVADGGHRGWSYQVDRAEFDKLLLDAAAEEPGVTVLEEARAGRLIFSGERVAGVNYTAGGRTRGATARLVVDASGRSSLVARSLNLRKTNGDFRMAAVFKHYCGVDEATNPGRPGDTQVGVHAEGWVWAIPIHDDVISVGDVVPVDVLRASNPEEMLDAHVKLLPRIRERIKGTRVWRGLGGEANSEYHCDTVAGPGFMLVGDAGAFTDPIFSGGVYLALASGRRAAEDAASWMAGERSEPEATKRYESFYKTGYDTYYRLSRAVHDRSAGTMGDYMQQILNADGIDEKQRRIALNGAFWTNENRFVRKVREHEEWRLFAPFDPTYVCPVHPDKSGV